MNAMKSQAIEKVSKFAEETLSLDSNMKTTVVDQSLNDLQKFIKQLLRTKKVEVGIIVVADTIK